MAANVELSFEETLTRIIQTYDSNLQLKPMQKFALEKLWKGETSVLVSLPTGYGKSLIFHLGGQLLAVKHNLPKWVTVVVSPLNVIQRDQLASLERKNVSAVRLDMAGKIEFPDGTQKVMDTAIQAEMEAGKYQLIFAHPEALLCSDHGLSLLSSTQFCNTVVLLAVDECHTIDTWGKSFRTAFKKLDALPSYFKCPVVALSATLTTSMWTEVPKHLGMGNAVRVCENPDKTNIFLNRKKKPGNRDIIECSERVYKPELQRLNEEGMAYPVTLCYMPLEWCVNAQIEAESFFGQPDLYTTKYAVFFPVKTNMSLPTSQKS